METAAGRKTDLSVSLEKANWFSLLFSIPFLALMIGAFTALWGAPALWAGFLQFTGNLLVFLLVFLAGVVVHEGIHALTWALFGKKPLRVFRFGVAWAALSPYAHCTEPLEVRAYRLGALMPGLLLGMLPALAGIISGNGWLEVFGILFTIAAGGDLLILWLIRKVPAGRLVEDHPSRAGCYVVEGS